MALFGLACLVGIAVGYARGGRLSNLTVPPGPFIVVIAAGLVLQLSLRQLPGETRLAAIIASYVLLVAAITGWAWTTWRESRSLRLAFLLLVLGSLMNLMVISVNGGMPVSNAAIAVLGGEVHEHHDEGIAKYLPSSADAELDFLGDVIPIPLPPMRVIISPGDVLLMMGIAAYLMSGMSVGSRWRRVVATSSREAKRSVSG